MLANEEKIDLAEAARISPGRPHCSAVWRWARRGIMTRGGDRLRLEHIRAGGRVFTSKEALDRFFAALAQADSEYFDRRQDAAASAIPRKRSGAQQVHASIRAGEELKKGGW